VPLSFEGASRLVHNDLLAEHILVDPRSGCVDNPVVPLANTVVDVNIDTIGREDATRPDLKDFIFVYCSNKAKADFNEARAETEKKFKNKLRIEIRESPPGSDNYVFERSGVPVIAYTTGHSKDYHKPSDTANKIHYDNLTNITQMIFSTVWEIAIRE
jgi:Zn-dependent M28 family amino/carboxypeptidase